MSFRHLRGERVLRSDDAYSELPNDYVEPVIEETSSTGFDPSDQESVSDVIDNESDSNNNDSDSDTIPEVTVEDLVNLATQIMRNEQSGNSNVRNGSVRLTFPEHFDNSNVNVAREIIVQHERNSEAPRLASNDGQYYIHPIQSSNNPQPSVLVRFRDDQERDQNVQIPFARNVEQPFWMGVTDFITVALMMLILLRIVRNTLSVTSFSTDILQDTFDYIDGMREESMKQTLALENAVATESARLEVSNSQVTSNDAVNSTLIMKFGGIVNQVFPSLKAPYKAMITVLVFYIYTMVSSGFLIASFIFSIFCFTLSVGKRWQDVKKLIAALWQDGEGCI